MTSPHDGGDRSKTRALVALAIVVALLGSGVGWLWWNDRQYQLAQEAGERGVLVAQDRAVTVLSYDYRDIDRDLQRARSVLTGDFLREFDRDALRAGPDVRNRQITVTVRPTAAALVATRPDEVVVLVFVNQSSKTTLSPDVQLSTVPVVVTLRKVGERWLVSNLERV